MKRLLLLTASFLCVTLLFFSCQKEVSVESGQKATGSLQNDASGDCLPKVVQGAYIAGNSLNGDSNYMEVQVNVVSPGTYTIRTDTVNGYSFSGSGNFSAPGLAMVHLRGSGTPASATSDVFIVKFDSSLCTIPITVLLSGSSTGPAVYTLQGAGSACGNFTPSGIYAAGTALAAANKVSVDVNVTTIGTYTIATNTVNGYSFKASGTFASPGVQTVILVGTGTPAAAGANVFTVTAGSSSCSFSITVGGAGSTGCGIVQGTYVVGTALAGSNTVTAQHTYATAGTYNVTATAVNGYSFNATVVVSASQAGAPVNIILNGTGTPLTAGTNSFTLNYGDGSTCSFTVTVNPAGPATHFPITANSWWSYEDPLTPGSDTLKTTNAITGSFGGNSYRGFIDTFRGAPVDTFYFRQSSNDYFENNLVDYYSAISFDNPVRGDINFLKENLTSGITWNATEFSGTVNGTPVKVRYVFTCSDANASLTYNGKTYNNVYKIVMKPQVSISGSPYQDDGTLWTNYYALGVGLIYQKGAYNNGTSTSTFWEMQIRNSKVY